MLNKELELIKQNKKDLEEKMNNYDKQHQIILSDMEKISNSLNYSSQIQTASSSNEIFAQIEELISKMNDYQAQLRIIQSENNELKMKLMHLVVVALQYRGGSSYVGGWL